MKLLRVRVGKANNRLILIRDLVDELKGSLVNKLIDRKYKKTIYDIKPKVCPHCLSKKMAGIEIMGAREGILLLECENCEEIFLKYEMIETEKELQLAKGYWTNPKDWGYCPKSQYN